ncbi:glycosyltransferase [Aquabacterium lacunae]|uniref:Glycosyltransferase n=2 Tax=Aquabacterium lacunae TaxID=2528630 RepID=A0A4Q9GXV7_9BURK|nr:glycosyltransferase [Aquabacterium lacunae]
MWPSPLSNGGFAARLSRQRQKSSHRMSLPKISIVTCSYQQGQFLDATMRSVLDQRYPELEYIVIDGGSKDNSVDVIQRHAGDLAYWVSEKDRGQTHALQKGFERATGEILGWLCSDDLLLPGALQAVGEFFRDHPDVDMVYGDALWIDAQGRYIRPKKEMPWSRFVFLFDFNYIAQPSCFWRRRLHDKVGGLQEKWNLNMDSDLWLRFASATQPAYQPGYWSGIRDYPEQKTRALRPAGQKEWDALIAREAPALASWPRKPLNLTARALRVGSKMLHGGYGAQPPRALVESLKRYEISGT